MFHAAGAPLIGFGQSPESLIMITGDSGVVEVLQKTLVVVFYLVLGTCFIALLARRLVRAPPRMRRILAPLLLAAIAIALRAVFEGVSTFIDQPFAREYVFWWRSERSSPRRLRCLLASCVRDSREPAWRSRARLQRTPPAGMQDVLAHALGDPRLELSSGCPKVHVR